MADDRGGLEESRDWVGRSGLVRSRNDRMIAGVCAGIARRFDVPVLIVRILMVVFALSGPGIFVYPILWILMPDDRNAPHQQR